MTRKINKYFAVFSILVFVISLVPAFPVSAAPTSVFINEIHYDNASTDVGEAIEIAGPAGTDLTGWSVVLYNGNGGAPYNTTALSGTIPDLGSGFGVVVVTYPSNGIQNGSPDGMALVDSSNSVVQFLSYEGTFAAVGGPADGMTSTDIGVVEGSSTPEGDSLQLTGTGTTYEDFSWSADVPNTFGAINTGQTFGTPTPPSITVFVNEIHYDNASTDIGEAIEIAGPACTDLSGWSLVLYNGNGGGSYDTVDLSGPIPSLSGGYGVIVVDFPSNGIQNGSPDGLALVDASNHVVQFLSYEGAFAATDGPASGMTSEDIGVSEASSTPIGYSLQLTGAGSTYPDFTWASAAPATFGAANTGQTFTGGGPTNPCGVGAAAPDLVSPGDSSLLTVAVTPGSNPDSTGLTVSCDLSAIGGSPTQAFFDDGTNGDVTGGDGTFSYMATVAASTATSFINMPCTVNDAEARTGSASIGLTVILPIGTVEGSVGNADNGATFASPYAGQTVVVQGVIYEKVIARTSSGSSTYGFFIQNTAATADGDSNSSDGIFVYMSYYTDLIGGYVPQVGDEIIMRGRVSEYFNLTELSSASALQVVRSGVDLDAELPAFEVNPPSDLADANRYWERREGMRGQVPADSVVLNGRNVFASTADAEVWVARSDSVVAQRTDPYSRRAFRDAHLLDDNYDPNNWDGNGYRILMGSLGLKATADDNTAMIAPARTFDTMTNAPIGGVYYSFGKYSVQIEEQIALDNGPDPAANNPPTTFDRTLGYSIVDYNLENLYDYRDNPFSGCDFNGAGNDKCSKTGTPFLSDITPSYDYVPADDAAYQARLNDIALQIINDLHSPDILMVQEVENQDICDVSGGAMVCNLTDNSNADGKPDVLQDLALKVASLGGPAYDAAFDSDSSDLRGILPAFMYRTDRVQLVSPVGDPVLGTTPAIGSYTSVPYDSDVSNPKTLNAVYTGTGACETSWVFPRAPSVGLFRIYHTAIGLGSPRDVYVINNHFKSGPDSCVAHRTEQANYNAALVAYIQAANPDARVVVGGDLNVYPRPDDPFAPIDQPGSSDQLGALYDPGLGLKNLWEVLLNQVPEAAYSYVYQGQAQTLDQMFVNPSMLAELDQIHSVHLNSDFPADYSGDVARGTSDHDPQLAAFSNLPTIDRLEALVQYYTDNGMITGNNTTRILLDRLERARRFQQNGQEDAYRDQLQAFIDQIYDKTPQFITQEAADSMTFEAGLLLSLP